MKPGSQSFYRLTKPALFLFSLMPLVYLLLAAFNIAGQGLGPNPVETLLHALGRWGLKFILLTLAMTPLRRWTGWNWLIRYRRMLGLFAFFYIALHFTVYLVLDQELDFSAICDDIIKRPYITLGMTGLLMLLALAATSTRAMMQRLGKKWKKLHQLVYVIAVLGVWHFYWQVKLDTFEPAVYAVIVLILLAVRVYFFQKRHQYKVQKTTTRQNPATGITP